jgi:hypothetical protein
MKNIAKKSIEDINNLKNVIFREFKKEDDLFIATDIFYVSEEIENGVFGFNVIDSNSNKILPYSQNNNIYISINNDNKYYIDLIILSNISLSLDDIKINKAQLIHKILENHNIIDEKLFEDLYFNEDFSKKINLEIPQKYNNKKIILEDIDVSKKYLFKINIIELNRTFYKYKI